jgi:hypothetical protein
MILNHPVQYFYELNKGESKGSPFIFVQNKKAEYQNKDLDIIKYANNKGEYVHIDAKAGINLDDLKHYLKKQIDKLPIYDMEMPSSWIAVRKFFIDNLDKNKNPNPKNLMTKEALKNLFAKKKVNPKTGKYLFNFLQQGGFIYAHKNLKEKIIINQEWALKAIYKILDRENEQIYNELLRRKGEIEVYRLFRLWGEDYTDTEKRIFLTFMQNCGLCFKIWLKEKEHYREEVEEDDVFIFPQFLAKNIPPVVNMDWQDRMEKVHVLKHEMEWLNFNLIHKFITALGRKAEKRDIWRNGISIRTPDGWFRVELNIKEKAIKVLMDVKTKPKLLLSVLKELAEISSVPLSWQISEDNENSFTAFDIVEWEQSLKQNPNQVKSSEDEEEEAALAKLADKQSSVFKPNTSKKQQVLFICSSPKGEPLLDYGTEIKKIREARESAKKRTKFKKIKDKTGIEAKQFVRILSTSKPDILHISMHASKSDTKGLYFEGKNGELEGLSLERFVESMEDYCEFHQKFNIVVLSACNSLRYAKAIAHLADYVVGMQDYIPDEAAALYAEKLYEFIFDGQAVELAHKVAAKNLKYEDIKIDRRLKFELHEIPYLIINLNK